MVATSRVEPAACRLFSFSVACLAVAGAGWQGGSVSSRGALSRARSRYEVSSNYLARICEQLNVPRPPRGCWAQKAAGAKLVVPALPEGDPGDDVEWTRGGDPYGKHPPAPKFTAITARTSRRA